MWQSARPTQATPHAKPGPLIGERWGVAQVVLSFGARNGGAIFAQWLRERIMQRKGYTRRDHVYIDTIALQSVPGTRLEVVNLGRQEAGGVAALNPAWQGDYLDAMREAHTMIFVFTAEWWKSQNCIGELDHWRRESLDRVRSGRPPLRTLGLLFPDAPFPVPGGMLPIRAERKYAVSSAKQRAGLGGNYREFFTIDEGPLAQLIGMIGRR